MSLYKSHYTSIPSIGWYAEEHNNIRLLLYLSCFYDSSNCCMGPKIVQISLNIYFIVKQIFFNEEFMILLKLLFKYEI